MCQSIQNGTGESLASENFGPLIKGQIGRDDDTRSFLSGRDDVEEQFTPELAGRDVTQFIQNQQVKRNQRSFESFQGSFISRFDHLRNQVGDAKEFHLLAELTRLDSKRRGQVGLARAGLTDQDDRFAIDKISPAHQFVDKHFVQGRLGLEVERFQGFQVWELCRLESPFGRPGFAFEQFQFRQLQQVAEVIDVLLRTTNRDLLAFAFHRRQFQLFEVVFQKDGGFRFEFFHDIVVPLHIECKRSDSVGEVERLAEADGCPTGMQRPCVAGETARVQAWKAS